MNQTHTKNPSVISVIVITYNDSEIIADYLKRLQTALQPTTRMFEIIVVDMGSNDKTETLLTSMIAKEPGLVYLQMSKNYGKEAAIAAGLRVAAGEVLVTLKAGHDPVDNLGSLLKKVSHQNNILIGALPKTEFSYLGRLSRSFFYLIANSILRIGVPEYTSDFMIFNRSVLNSLDRVKDKHGYIKAFARYLGLQVSIFNYKPENPASAKRRNVWDQSKLGWQILTQHSHFLFWSGILFFVGNLLAMSFLLVIGPEALANYVGEQFNKLEIMLFVVAETFMITGIIILCLLNQLVDNLRTRPMFNTNKELRSSKPFHRDIDPLNVVDRTT